MKHLLTFFFAVSLLAACGDDSKHVTIYEDMFSFTEGAPSDGYTESVTRLTRHAGQLDLYIMRNYFAASAHPRQGVQITVDEKLSTAKADADFGLVQQTVMFQGKEDTLQPLSMRIYDGAAGKTIVLQLVYGYHDECPSSGRKCDRLTITVK